MVSLWGRNNHEHHGLIKKGGDRTGVGVGPPAAHCRVTLQHIRALGVTSIMKVPSHL